MSKQIINIGTIINDGTGDTLRAGATKVNENFTELYSVLTKDTSLSVVNYITAGAGITVDQNNGNTITNYFFAFSWWNVRYYYRVQTSTDAGTSVVSNYGRSFYNSVGDMNSANNGISGITNPNMNAPIQNVPIDGGVSLLLGAGAVAHLKKKKLMSKFKNA